MVELIPAELVPDERENVVRIRIATEHRLLEDQVTVDVDVEDPALAGHNLDGSDHVLHLLEQPRRQTGGVRERPSGDAILDSNVMAVRDKAILSEWPP
jgi:hypothetical protein